MALGSVCSRALAGSDMREAPAALEQKKTAQKMTLASTVVAMLCEGTVGACAAGGSGSETEEM